MLRILRPRRFALASLLLAAAGATYAQQGPFVPLPYDYYETAGRVQVQQPINHLLGPGGRRLFEDSGLSTDGGPGVKASGAGQIKNPSGNTVPVAASGRVSGSAAAGAIGRAIPKLLKQVSGPLGVGFVLFDLAKELGFDLSKDEAGNPVVKKLDNVSCSVSPCYNYQGLNNGVWYTSLSAAGANSVGVKPANCSGFTLYAKSLISVALPTKIYFQYDYCGTSNPALGTGSTDLQRKTVAPFPPAYLPSTEQELIDAIAAKSGWPSTSNLSKALADSVAATGEKLSTGPVSVTGPSSSPGTTTTTNNTTNNTTTTSTTNHQHTYQGDTINTTTTTTNVTVNNTTGETTNSETTTTQAPPASEPVETCGLPGKPACKIDETGTPTDGVKDMATPKSELDKVRTDSQAEIDKAATIQAPQWSFTFQLPTGCAPYVTGLRGVVLNVCAYQPIIHDLLAMIWAAATVFACIGMVGRTIREA